jgi:hypothetical protein
MHANLHKGMALALLMSDTAQSDNHLANGIRGLTNAGMVDAALTLTERIRSPAIRLRATLAAIERRLQAGDTTGARGAAQEAMRTMETRGMDVRADFHNSIRSLAFVVLSMGMVNEVLEWVDTRPSDQGAYVLVALVERMGQ